MCVTVIHKSKKKTCRVEEALSAAEHKQRLQQQAEQEVAAYSGDPEAMIVSQRGGTRYTMTRFDEKTLELSGHYSRELGESNHRSHSKIVRNRKGRHRNGKRRSFHA